MSNLYLIAILVSRTALPLLLLYIVVAIAANTKKINRFIERIIDYTHESIRRTRK